MKYRIATFVMVTVFFGLMNAQAESIYSDINGSVTIDTNLVEIRGNVTENRVWTGDTASLTFNGKAEIKVGDFFIPPYQTPEWWINLLPKYTTTGLTEPPELFTPGITTTASASIDFGSIGLLESNFSIGSLGNMSSTLSGIENTTYMPAFSTDYPIKKIVDINWSLIPGERGNALGTMEVRGQDSDGNFLSIFGDIDVDVSDTTLSMDLNQGYIGTYTVNPEDMNWSTGVFSGTGSIELKGVPVPSAFFLLISGFLGLCLIRK